jgi:hypothetical protein
MFIYKRKLNSVLHVTLKLKGTYGHSPKKPINKHPQILMQRSLPSHQTGSH